MLKVAHKIMFFFETEFPIAVLKTPLAGVLNQIQDVCWDLTVLSHGAHGEKIRRTAEITIFVDEAGRHDTALRVLADWAKRTDTEYQVLSAREVVG